ncbi:hypothetical protein [Porphyrobacter sp. CACIAM 03H1]|uniref:hypothetical protein n=1 Tax=Porphyrobacter sp. CACIAM 03H1 TaxID=2003315 RepID=UPI0015605FA2|nr:hypothetical protein [Porphyrobacter sp. CACIAM 03H1]
MGNNLSGAEPQKLRGRATLKVRNPLIENALQAANFDGETIQQATLWGNALLRARDAWADENRKRRRYYDAPVDGHQDGFARQNRRRA